jgi:hypothetical protein
MSDLVLQCYKCGAHGWADDWGYLDPDDAALCPECLESEYAPQTEDRE